MADREVHEVIVLGAGIAGASVAAELAEHLDVLVLEAESQAGYHSTGRSAALFIQNYGPASVRALTAASRAFFDAPPQGFVEHPLLSARGVLTLAHPGQEAALEATFAESSGLSRLTPDQAIALVPALRPAQVLGAALEPDAADIDVHALHQGYLRLLKARGGQLVCNARASQIERAFGHWQITTPSGIFAAYRLVNAAGAWSDEVARLAGLTPIGLVPKRRTAILVAAPPEAEHWPLIGDAGSTWYCRWEAGGKLLVSPADETPVPPSDVQPEELDVALAVDRLQTALDISVRRIDHRWAGLRTFAPDGTLLIGWDPSVDGFFWVAGQGGYGIQTAPAAARLATSLLLERPLPDSLKEHGVRVESTAPGRFRDSPALSL